MIKTREILLSGIFMLFMLGLVSGWTDNGNLAQNITGCGTLNTANAIYTQTQNITPTGSYCLLIRAENITYNGDGYWFNNSNFKGFVIYIANSSITIKNTNINVSNLPSSGGIGFATFLNNFASFTYNAVIINNTFTGRIGFFSDAGNSINIINNTFTGFGYNGILLLPLGLGYGVSYINITGNTFTNTIYDNANTKAISAGENAAYLTISDNFFNSSYPIYFDGSSHNTIKSNLLIKNPVVFLNIRWSRNNLIRDMFINATTCSIDLAAETQNNTLLNITTGATAECMDTTECFNYPISNGISCELTRKWYFNAQVNYSNKLPVNQGNVAAYSVSGALIDSQTTNMLGKANLQLIEYFNNGFNKTYYSNYTINATKNGLTASYISYNANNNGGNTFILSKIKCHKEKIRFCIHKKCFTKIIKVCN